MHRGYMWMKVRMGRVWKREMGMGSMDGNRMRILVDEWERGDRYVGVNMERMCGKEQGMGESMEKGKRE